MKRLGDSFRHHPSRFGLGLGTFVALSIVGISMITVDDRPRGVFSSGDDDFERLEQVFRDFGSDDSDCLIVLEGEDWFRTDSLRLLREIIAAALKVDGVRAVASFDDVKVFDGGLLPRPLIPDDLEDQAALDRARLEANAHPFVRGQLLSEDGKTVIVIARLDARSHSIRALRPMVEDLSEVLESVEERANVRARLTGIPPIRVEIYATLQGEQIRLSLIGAAMSALIAFLIFRRPAPVLVSAAAAILAAGGTVGALGLTGSPINILNTTLPTLVLVIAFTDAVHIVMAIRRARRDGAPRREASAIAIERLGLACALTSLTTAIGFGSLIVARVDSVQSFGREAALGVSLAFIAVVIAVPWLASLFPRKAWHGGDERGERAKHFMDSLSDFIANRARLLTAVGLITTAVLLTLSSQIRPDNRLTEAIPEHHEALHAMRHVDEAFDGAQVTSVLVEWPETLDSSSPQVREAVRRVRDAMSHIEPFASPLSFLELLAVLPNDQLLPAVPESIRERLLREDLNRALVVARVPDLGTAELDPSFTALEDELASIQETHPDLELSITGTSYIARRNINLMIQDLVKGLGLAAFVIFIILAVLFRSLRLGLISVVPNIFPLVVSASILVFAGRSIQVSTAMVFTVCLGIAVDDTIHFLNRFRQELRIDGITREAVKRTYYAVGSTLLITTLTLVAGFAIIFFSQITPLRTFSILACLGMFAALIGDLVFLPALLIAFLPAKHPIEPREVDRRFTPFAKRDRG